MTEQATETRTYWHVASEGYSEGEDLYCWDELEQMGYTPTWKFEDEPFDTDVICLFETLAEAQEFERDFGGTILRVELPEDISTVTVSEGYPAVFGRISAQHIKQEVGR